MSSPFEIHGSEMRFCCFFLGHFLAPALLSTLIIGSFAKNLELKRKMRGKIWIEGFIGMINLGIFDSGIGGKARISFGNSNSAMNLYLNRENYRLFLERIRKVIAGVFLSCPGWYHL